MKTPWASTNPCETGYASSARPARVIPARNPTFRIETASQRETQRFMLHLQVEVDPSRDWTAPQRKPLPVKQQCEGPKREPLVLFSVTGILASWDRARVAQRCDCLSLTV